MPTDKPRLLKDLLAGSTFKGLAARAAATDRLARRVQALLPSEVAEHVTGANLRDRRLIVIVDGAAWAALVRFEATAIRRRLRELHELEVGGMTVRVRPREPGIEPPG